MTAKIIISEPVIKSERFVEITPEMIEAGLRAMHHGRSFSQLEALKNIYRAMRRVDRT